MVIITEGEKAADALNKARDKWQSDYFIAMTSGGAQSAATANWQPLAGRKVFVFPDEDKDGETAGADYGQVVKAALTGIADSVAVLDIAPLNLPPKGDAVEWLAAGGDLDGLLLLIDATRNNPKDNQLNQDVSETDNDGWQTPQPLAPKVEAEDYPLASLPDTIRAAVEEVQAFVKSPVAMVAASALSAVSLATQALYDAERAQGLQSPIGLFMLTLGDSGERKSTCDTKFTQAIKAYENEQAEVYKPIVKQFNASLATWNAEREGLLSEIKTNSKKTSPDTANKQAGLRHDMEQHELNEPTPPRVPRLTYSDVTPEELAYKLAFQYPTAGITSAEAGIVFGSHGMKSDSAMKNLAQLNTLWDGGDLQIDRRTSDSFTVCGARLTMALMIQEATLRAFFEKSGQLARGTGFMARFLVSMPESTQGQRPFSEPPLNYPCLDAFNNRITAMLNQPVPMDDNGALSPLLLTLTPEAKAAWIKYHDAIESELVSGGALFDVRDVASKSADNAVRLAALFHVFEGGIGAISEDAFSRASEVAIWHLSESLRFFGDLAAPQNMADAARLDKWIIEHCKREKTHCIKRRDIQREGAIRDGARLDAAIKELIELDRIRIEKDGKQIFIWINPALMTEGGAS